MEETLSYFKAVRDPRSIRNQKHPLMTLIGTTLLASLAGIDSFSGIADFTESHIEALEKYFEIIEKEALIAALLNPRKKKMKFANENENTNTPLTTFSDLHYILNQKPIPQKEFERVDSLFTPEGFLCPKILIDIWKNHDAFSRHPNNTSNKQSISKTSEITNSFNLNSANKLITELTNNFDVQENCVNWRKDRWKGRKRLVTIPIAAEMNGKYSFI